MSAVAKTNDVQTMASAADAAAAPGRRGRYLTRLLAAELSALAAYFDRLVQWQPLVHDSGELLAQIACAHKTIAGTPQILSAGDWAAGCRALVLLNANFNHSVDVQGELAELKPCLARGDRLAVVLYNPYFHWLYRLAHWLRVKQGQVPCTFLTHADLARLARLAGFELVRLRTVGYCPWRLAGLGNFLNWVLPAVPGLRRLAIVSIALLRPVVPEQARPSLSIVIPARNERGTIEEAVEGLPEFGGAPLEVLFVEGGSDDGTWEQIQQVAADARGSIRVRCLQQPGRGKADAVRHGLSQAGGDLLAILDADVTVPPELLERFYDAWCAGLGDFINGNRLLYPIERGAMRFLNRLANTLLARLLGAVLDVPLGDSLCGTKLFARRDYERMAAWQADFASRDPFGDFDLLSAAAVLGLGIVEVPVHYRARTYGRTNIRRFRDGWRLLRLLVRAFFRIKTGRL